MCNQACLLPVKAEFTKLCRELAMSVWFRELKKVLSCGGCVPSEYVAADGPSVTVTSSFGDAAVTVTPAKAAATQRNAAASSKIPPPVKLQLFCCSFSCFALPMGMHCSCLIISDAVTRYQLLQACCSIKHAQMCCC